MEYIKRTIEPYIIKDFFKGKAIIIVGARQVGKTTLLKQLEKKLTNKKILKLNGDIQTDSDLLTNTDFTKLDNLIADNEILFIDEAQRIKDIGLITKILVDNYQNSKQIILTGSSSINLLQSTQEPLTGRKFTYHLYPISYEEYVDNKGILATTKTLSDFMLFGMYPEILNIKTNENKIRSLEELSSSYLFKDILEFQEIRNPEVLSSLLKALALQIGSQVSYSELSKILGIDSKTVERYIDLLEKSFVIYRLPSYSRNKRREITKNKKIYFYDIGIRNSILNNFNTYDKRNDIGHVWEDFLISERIKYTNYHRIYSTQHFWRTYDGSEIDFVEDRDGKLFGYEIKYTSNKATEPTKWKEYENSSFQIINKENLKGFIY